MPVLHSFASPLHALLDRLHPLFTCCASCGEIRHGGRGYLCGSLTPDFAVDGVILSAGDGNGNEQADADSLKHRFPWLRRVHVAESDWCALPDLAGHFIVLRGSSQGTASAVPAPGKQKPGLLDFFTPNGIPLLVVQDRSSLPPEELAFSTFMAERGLRDESGLGFAQGLPALTREILDGFLPFHADFLARRLGMSGHDLKQPGLTPGFFSALARWAYAVGLAVPVSREAASGHASPRSRKPRGRAAAHPVFVRPRGSSLRQRTCNLIHDISVSLHPVTLGCDSCGHAPASLETLTCHELAADFPVDVVYTWVNGDDPAHAAKRETFLPRQADIHSNSLHAARFRDNDDLRYSLRSLDLHAPWVRQVILVTDAQKPAWLNAEHPKIRVVDHREIIPAHCLPTFNSHVIETYLHAIPGLAEHFIYMNDDFFLGRPCRKTEFFTPNGLPLSPVDWRWRRRFGYWWTKTPHAQSYYNTLDILKEKGEPTDPKFITAHGPYAQTRSNVIAAFDFYQDTLESFAGNRFRTVNELALYSHALPLLLYRKKRLVPCDERHIYVQTDRADRVAYFTAILNARNDQAAPLFFCVNDVGDNSGDQQWRDDFHALMAACYPEPSSFEQA